MCGSSALQQGISAFLSVLKRRLVRFGFKTEKWSKWFPSAFDFGLECQVALISDCYYGWFQNMVLFRNGKNNGTLEFQVH
ncbi:unnamed protein product [Rhizophagus irregularis]|nr:unnamed protein product [Rhizophagus irregularis]